MHLTECIQSSDHWDTRRNDEERHKILHTVDTYLRLEESGSSVSLEYPILVLVALFRKTVYIIDEVLVCYLENISKMIDIHVLDENVC